MHMRRFLTLSLAVPLALPLLAMGSSTAAPASTNGQRVSAAAAVELFDADANFDYQLGGNRALDSSTTIVVRDRKASPAPEAYNICYVNGFQTQPDERRLWKKHSNLLLRKNGRLVNDGEWSETILDIRTPAKRQKLAQIVGRWIDKCSTDGFDAVEFDNLDSYTRSKNMLKHRHAVAFAKLLVNRSHANGLAAAQKNLAEWNGRRAGFDFAVAEECGEWKECGSYTAYYGSQVLMVEYTDRAFAYTCERFGAQVPVVRRDMALSPAFTPRFC